VYLDDKLAATRHFTVEEGDNDRPNQPKEGDQGNPVNH